MAIKRIKVEYQCASDDADLLGAPKVFRTFTGRAAWALDHLIVAGARGCTPLDTPGPRWSHYVFLLRQEGVPVKTVNEAHGGPYSGTHARYLLAAPVTVIEREAA